MPTAGKICLLNPGPVTLTARVRQALLGPDMCHREQEFAELLGDVRTRLGRVYPEAAGYAPVLLTGSGTAAVEAMVGSLIPHGGKAVVVANGVYGERIGAMLQAQGKPLELVRSAWTEPIDLPRVEKALAGNEVTHVIAVHHETTTGRLNDLAPLGALCRAQGVPLLLDTVSSFGGEAIDWSGWNVGACAATANKCLHGVPGICFALVRHDLLAGRSGSRSLYLDLFRQHEEQGRGFTPFTPAVQVLYALREALAEMEEEGGWTQRQRLYRERSRLVRGGLRELGFSLLLAEEGAYSSMLSSFVLPEGVSFAQLHDRAKAAGFVIYPGQQALLGSIFRIAVMGDLSRQDLERFLSVCAGALDRRD
jgi:2-aminoethylphosphonate-pyruvate transaminase